MRALFKKTCGVVEREKPSPQYIACSLKAPNQPSAPAPPPGPHHDGPSRLHKYALGTPAEKDVCSQGITVVGVPVQGQFCPEAKDEQGEVQFGRSLMNSTLSEHDVKAIEAAFGHGCTWGTCGCEGFDVSVTKHEKAGRPLVCAACGHAAIYHRERSNSSSSAQNAPQNWRLPSCSGYSTRSSGGRRSQNITDDEKPHSPICTCRRCLEEGSQKNKCLFCHTPVDDWQNTCLTCRVSMSVAM